MTQWGLDTLFNPAKRHMDEEKRRLQSTREEIGDSSGGKRIDLESGKVVIRRDDEDEVASDADADATPAPAKGTKTAKSAKAVKSAQAGPKPSGTETPAQARARARRAAAKKQA